MRLTHPLIHSPRIRLFIANAHFNTRTLFLPPSLHRSHTLSIHPPSLSTSPSGYCGRLYPPSLSHSLYLSPSQYTLTRSLFLHQVIADVYTLPDETKKEEKKNLFFKTPPTTPGKSKGDPPVTENSYIP